MCNVYVMTQEKQKMVVLYDGRPALFETDTDAWDFIQQYMSQKEHPRFAWIKEVVQSESSQT